MCVVVIYVVGCRQRLISRRFDSGRRRNATGRPGHAVRSRGARFTLVSRSFRFSSTFVSSPRRTFVCVSRFRVVFLLLNLFFFQNDFHVLAFLLSLLFLMRTRRARCDRRVKKLDSNSGHFGSGWIGFPVGFFWRLEENRVQDDTRKKKGNN